MTAVLNAIYVVLPIVLMLGIGLGFARARGFSTEQAQGLGKLVYWVCLPALIFREVMRADPGRLFDARLCLGIAAVMILTVIAGYRYARWRKVPEKQVGVIAQAAFRSNMMYVGLPVIIFYLQSRLSASAGAFAFQQMREHASALAAVTTVVAIPILNIGSVIVFILPHRHNPERRLSLGKAAWLIVSNPLVLAAPLGLLFARVPELAEWLTPQSVLGRTLDLASSAALPLALLSVGAILDPARALSSWRRSTPVAALKLLLMPAAGLLLLHALGVRGDALATGVVLLACPTAAASYAMALEMHGDDVYAAELVAVTTLLCPLTLVGWLSVLNAMGA